MNKSERLGAILDLLAETDRIEVGDVVSRLHVSTATARRDLDSLASQRLLSRTRGGAMRGSTAYDLPGRYNRNEHAEQKQAIARLASTLIPKGAIVGLTGGTTTTALAQVLATRSDLMEPSTKPSLTVVTNAINIAAQLAIRPNIKIMVTGGVINPRSYELVGPFADMTMEQVTLDVAMIGVNAIDPVVGPTVSDEAEAKVNALMAKRASQSFIIADSSKIGQRAFAAMDNGTPGHLITDGGITPGQRTAFESQGMTVTTAPR